MATSGQTLNDRINAARYALAGQGLARCVCKATTEEVIGPKKKHLDYLLACTHEPNVSIPQLANLLIERTNHIYWVVVFKALVTVHHLMSYGNERFTQYLASSNYSFELSTFLDKTAARDFSMSTFIRRYSRYINEKALSYRLLAFDFCKIKRGNEGVLRIMPIDRLLKTLPILQNQLDALLEFDCGANDLNNGVINACFMLLFRDLIGLFACHNDGIINLLNKYFTLNRKMCREAFDLYKKFLIRTDKVSDFLRVAELVGIDRDEIPDLRRAPSSLIEALEQHLQNIESNKKILKQQQQQQASKSASTTGGEFSQIIGSLTPPTSRRPNSPGNLAAAAAVLSSTNTSSSVSNINSQSDSEFSLNTFKDEEVRKALEEEARVLSQYGTSDGGMKSLGGAKSKSSRTSTGGSGNREGSPKFAVSTIPKSIDDIFGDADSFGNSTSSNTNTNNTSASHDSCSQQSGATLDSLSNTPSTSNKSNKVDLESIKLAIISATNSLVEGSNSKDSATSASKPAAASKKASDELFSLLDPSSMSSSSNSTNGNGGGKQQLPAGSQLGDPLSPFATANNASPFDLPAPLTSSAGSSLITGQNGTHSSALKKGNPFPDVLGDGFSTVAPTNSASVSSAFQASFSPIAPMNQISTATHKTTTTTPSTTPMSNSTVFKTGTTTANYTNLSGLEAFGDLLQPMNSSANYNNNNNNNRGPGSSSTLAGGKTSAFNSLSGLPSTGLFKGDLDSTLANLAQNLTFDGIKAKK